MIDLIQKIPAEELKMIDNYRLEDKEVAAARAYNSDRGFAPIEDILKEWNTSKQDLYALLGNNFILSKYITVKKDKEIIKDEMWRLVRDSSFKKRLIAYAYDAINIDLHSPFSWENFLSIAEWLLSAHELINNKLDGRMENSPCKIVFKESGHNLQISNGTKPLRALKKIAEECHIDGFEEFRLQHSRILNNKELSGELCLSIHPLDYMTMSDNDCDWTSCMSWRKNIGAYRAGTIEMMNSPVVIEAYLKSSVDMKLSNGNTWSNKKWRELFVVNKDCILGIKGYPYDSDALEEVAINWIRELAKENLNWEYEDPIKYRDSEYKICFYTNIMYNDVYSTHPLLLRDKELEKEGFSLNYSGNKLCVYSGKSYDIDNSNEESGSFIVCETYSPYIICNECGTKVLYNETEIINDEYCVCQYCYDNAAKDLINNSPLIQSLENEEYHQYIVRYKDMLSYDFAVFINDEDIKNLLFVKDINSIKQIIIENRWWTDKYLFVDFNDLTDEAKKLFIKYVAQYNRKNAPIKGSEDTEIKINIQDLKSSYHDFKSWY